MQLPNTTYQYGSAAQERLRMMRSSAVRVLMLVAPAGYGKTTAANALRADYTHAAVCDCSAIEDAKSFVRAVLLALAQEKSSESKSLADLQTHFSAAQSDMERTAILDAAWIMEGAESLFIFENAESLAPSEVLTTLLTRLLNTAPASRRIVVCSRTPLPARASRYLPPHRLSTLTTRHFALSKTEAAMLLQREKVDEAYWDRIITIAGGWPIVLLLLARLYHEDRLDVALTNAKDVAFEDLFIYVLHEVLAPLEPSVRRVMTLCAAVPQITAEELRVANGYSEIELEATIRKAVLLERDGGILRVHPLLQQVLLQNNRDLPKLVLPIAQFARTQGMFVRSSLIYRLAGDTESAADALAELSLQDLQRQDAAHELAELPLDALRKHAKLLVAAEHYRSDIDGELQSIYNQLSDDDEPEVIVSVAELYSDTASSMAEVVKILHAPLVQRAVEKSSFARTLLAGWEEGRACHFGAATSVENALLKAYEVLRSANLPVHSGRIANYLTGLRRRRCDAKGAMYWRDIALMHARSGAPRKHAAMLLCAISDAFFWGDDAGEQKYYEELEAAQTSTRHPDYSWVLRALDPNTIDSALPLWDGLLTQRALIMAASKTNPEARRSLLDRAEQASSFALPLGVLLARAASYPEARSAMCNQILSMLDAVEMPEYYNAVVAYSQGAPSVLTAYASHFEPKAVTPIREASRPGIALLEIMRERLFVDGRFIKLTVREAAFLTFLSRRRTGTPREEIQDALWPDSDEVAARDALYSLLHRLRKRIGKVDIVESVGNAYRLAGSVQVDAWDIEFLAQRLQRDDSDSIRDVERAYKTYQERTYPHLQQLEWFSPIEYRLHENARTLARFLIAQSKSRGDHDATIAYAKELIREDPCDEWANQVLIQTYIDGAEHAEANHAYRAYCKVLEHEIGVQPTAEMQELAGKIVV
jgi:DNA-binding SARP family transcriptional activator